MLALPEGVEWVPSRTLAPGVELKADGAGVVLPPSNHESGGMYSILIAAPLAPLPTWVLELISKPELTVHEGGGEGRTVQPTESRFELPERIYEGTRNRTLYEYACSLRAHGCDHGQILDELRCANEERCVSPLSDDEVRKIAGSAARHAKGNASTVPLEVIEVVALLEEKARVRTAKGLGGRSRWACYRALLDCAKRHGKMHHGRDIAVRISIRQLALDAGLSLRTTYRALDALNSGLVYRPSRGEGATPGVLALRVPARVACEDTIRTTPPSPPAGVSSCYSAPLYKLRHGAGRLGKTAAAVLEQVVECPGASPREIAARLGRERRPESLRAPLKKLVDRGLLERRVRGRYCPVENWPHVLDRERTLSGEKLAENLDRAQYEREREEYRQRLAEQTGGEISRWSS